MKTRSSKSVSSQLAAAAMETAISPVDPGGDALATACRTLGQTLGIEVRAPQTAGSDQAGRVERSAGRPGAGLGFSRAAGHARPDWWRRAAASRCWASWPTRAIGRSRWCRRRPACDGAGRPIELFDHEGRSRPVDLALARRLGSSAWMFYRTLPDEPQTKFDLFRFSLKLPGLARELWMVFFMALLAALLGLVDPDRGRHPGRPGHSGGRSRRAWA